MSALRLHDSDHAEWVLREQRNAMWNNVSTALEDFCSVIFDNENENGEKRENNEFVNEN